MPTFYLDYLNGLDATTATPLGWWSVAFDNGTGNAPSEGDACTGATSGHHGHLTVVGTITGSWAGNNAAGILYFYGVDDLFHSGEQIDWHDGHCHATAAAVYCAWKTLTLGATLARIAPADIIRIAKSPAPTSLGANSGTWTNCQSGGGFAAAGTITTMADNGAGKIRLTVTTHGFVTGDVIQVIGLVTTGTTYEANGAWIITRNDANTFDLDDSVYVNTRASGGTAQKINSKAVKLTAAQTFTIDRCENQWSNGVDGTASLVQVSTDAKEGNGCCKILMDAATQANQKQAYHATGTLAGATLNGFQKLSFWIKNEVAIADGTTWYVGLCSDNAGATVIDTFPIPAIPSTGRWVPLTITRSGGGNLGGNASSDVLSIAVWSGATAPTASKYIYVDNFEACTSAGLNLQSLISKNATEQSSTATTNAAEAWYGIQSIFNKVVLLDNDVNTKSNAGRGYSDATAAGTAETCATYIRETTKVNMVADYANAQEIMDSGDFATGNIQYQGGFNTATNEQTGVTFFDGLSGAGYGIYCAKSYITLNYINGCRYDNFLLLFLTNNITLTTVTDGNNCKTGGVIINNCSNVNINTWINGVNNGTTGGGGYFTGSSTINITTLNNLSNNITYGFNVSNSFGVITNLTARNNTNYGFTFTNGIVFIKNYTSVSNSTASVNPSTGNLFIQNATISETVAAASTSNANARLFINKLASTGYSRIDSDNAYAISQAATAGGTGNEWKVFITNVIRNSAYPFKMSIAKVAVAASAAVDFSAYIKKSHASDIVAQLVCKGGQLAGIASDVTTLAPGDTSRNSVALASMTPTEAGVLEFELWVWWAANTADENVIIDDITVTQA